MTMSLQEISEYSKANLWGPFPYQDCRELQRISKRKDGLVPELDTYFAAIAGLASGTHWQHWPLKRLQHNLDYVRRDAFGHCPALRRHRDLDQNAPELHKYLNAAETIRQELIPYLEAVITPRELASRISRGRKK